MNKQNNIPLTDLSKDQLISIIKEQVIQLEKLTVKVTKLTKEIERYNLSFLQFLFRIM